LKITVTLGEPFWRQIEAKEVTLELKAGATVADMIKALEKRFPALETFLTQADLPPTVFLGDELANPETPLTEDAKPMLIWALSGG
jgi:xanthine dehydrogenase iron-sulfur cluster and FAD-binding subunit A